MSQFPLSPKAPPAELSSTVHAVVYSVTKSEYAQAPLANPATHAQLHPVLFRLKDTVNAGELQLHVEKFNGLDGISASLEPFLGQKFLDLVSWPDKSEGFNWCLTVLARDAEALKNYLHSSEHKAWAASAGPRACACVSRNWP